mgnify:CR=1 FL=1
MIFIGIMSECKSYENIKEKLKNEDINLIHINKKSIKNIKNIKFETLIIDTNLEDFQQEKEIIEQICNNAKYVFINTDLNIENNLEVKAKKEIITYGLNQKATVTVSSIKDRDILIYVQRNIKDNKEKSIEVGEKLVKIKEGTKLKNYEILILYIIFLIYNYPIIDEI